LEFVDFGSRMTDQPYAILSHRWTDSELNYRQYRDLDKSELKQRIPAEHNTGLAKILWGCHLARLDDLRYFWIDTCRINKNNVDDQTELSSSIMSMWKWYNDPAVCYAYLATTQLIEAQVAEDPFAFTDWQDTKTDYFGHQAPLDYFRRGWTPQELLAPRGVMFFNASWLFIGARYDLTEQIHNAT
jgi:hypothetical protein